MEKILFNDLSRQWDIIRDVTAPEINYFFSKGMYLGGGEVEEFESSFKKYTSSKHAVGVSNGSDGLRLALEALDISGRVNVIIPSNTFIADALAVKYQRWWNYTITYIDPDQYFQMNVDAIDEYLSTRSESYDHTVIMAVHLYGHTMDVSFLRRLREKHKFFLIEDASQSHGSQSTDGMVGSLGDMTVYSLYPGKNLGAMGDAGIVTTNHDGYAERLIMLRNYGSRKKYYHEIDGWNNRLDSLQAIILKNKLPYLDEWNAQRAIAANTYKSSVLSEVDCIDLPRNAEYCTKNTYHIFPLLVKDKRDELAEYLRNQSVPTIIHYPFPLHRSPEMLQKSKQLLSLPIHPFISEEQIHYIAGNVEKFFHP